MFISEKISPKVFEDSAFDLIISTLTIGHIKDIHLQFQEWDRILKTGGKILITDFHPDAFSAGMKRSFPHKDEVIEVENYLYETEYLKKIFSNLKWEVISVYVKNINEDVKHLFEKQNYMPAYDKFYGTPLISGMLLKKN